MAPLRNSPPSYSLLADFTSQPAQATLSTRSMPQHLGTSERSRLATVTRREASSNRNSERRLARTFHNQIRLTAGNKPFSGDLRRAQTAPPETPSPAETRPRCSPVQSGPRKEIVKLESIFPAFPSLPLSMAEIGRKSRIESHSSHTERQSEACSAC